MPHRLRAATMSSLWDGYGKGKLSVHGNQGRHCCQRSLAHAKAPTPSRKQAPPGRSHRMNSTSDQQWGVGRLGARWREIVGVFFSETQQGFSGSSGGLTCANEQGAQKHTSQLLSGSLLTHTDTHTHTPTTASSQSMTLAHKAGDTSLSVVDMAFHSQTGCGVPAA